MTQTNTLFLFQSCLAAVSVKFCTLCHRYLSGWSADLCVDFSWSRMLFSSSWKNPKPIQPVQGKRMLCMLHSFSLIGYGTAGKLHKLQARERDPGPVGEWRRPSSHLLLVSGEPQAWVGSCLPPFEAFYHSLTPCTTVACASADKAASGRWECAGRRHRGKGRESTASVHSLPWTKESSAIKSAAVLFLLWLFAFRQQHIYWLFIGCEHSEQWLCGQQWHCLWPMA